MLGFQKFLIFTKTFFKTCKAKLLPYLLVMFVLELGFDDIPASFLQAFFDAKKSFVRKKFGGKSRFFLTPRRIIISSENVSENLQDILEEFLTFEWKSMRWEKDGHRFIRPLRWIFAMESKWGLDFELWGVRSSNITYSHRVFGRKIQVPSAEEFFPLLSENGVVYSQGERRRKIEEALRSVGVEPSDYKELISIAVFSTENPYPVLCEADTQGIPPEIAKSIIKDTLLCFPIDERSFLAICDNPNPDEDKVRQGYSFVANARFDDARFYISEDRKIPFSDRVHLLERVEFHPRFGSFYERQVIVSKICDVLVAKTGRGDRAKLRRASMLAKADITTGLYREFPDFAGYIGMWYALQEGEEEEIARAIWEHTWYDKLPETETGLLLSVADKIFHILVGFTLGFEITSESDPYGLRKSARALIKLMIDGDVDVSLYDVVEFVFPFFVERYVSAWGEDEEKVSEKVADGFERALKFFDERLEVYLSEIGFPKDIVRAVLEVASSPCDAYLRAKALSDATRQKFFKDTFWVARRVSNIIFQAQKKGFEVPQEPTQFTVDVERKLFDVAQEFSQEFSQLVDEKKYMEALEKVAQIRPVVDEFFNNVMVLDSDEKKRSTRLAILRRIKDTLDRFADFSKLEKRG